MSESLEGLYPELNAEQSAKVAKLREKVDGLPDKDCPPSHLNWMKHHPRLYLTQWLIARKWDVDTCFESLRDANAWRLERGMETSPLFPSVISVKGYDLAELQKLHGTGDRPTDQFVDKAAAALRPYSGNGWCKWDKAGRPVYYERSGKTKCKPMVDRLRKMMPPGEPLHLVTNETHLQSNEVGRILVEYQRLKHEREGKPYVGQVTVVMDCEGLTMGSFYGPAMDLLKYNTTIDQKYNAEGLNKTYIVNAPKMVKIGWNMVRMWLDANVQSKVVFCSPGEQTRTALREAIDDDCLPAFLGGTLECEGGCVPDLEESDEAVASEEPETVELYVGARGGKDHNEAVLAGTELSWQFVTVNSQDIVYSVAFVPTSDDAKAPEVPVLPPSGKVQKGSGSFTAPSDGFVKLIFDNSIAWVKGKTIHLRVSSVLPPSSP